MEFKGTLIKKMDAVRITEKFTKREFVVTDKEDKYPQVILFELVNDRTKELDAVNEGDEINVHFQLRGREWINPKGETKYFISLNAFKIALTKKGDGVPTPSTPPQPNAPLRQEPAKQAQEPVLTPTPDDDLPF